MYPNSILYILWPQSTYIGTTLRPKYIRFGHMDPQGVLASSSIPWSLARYPEHARGPE